MQDDNTGPRYDPGPNVDQLDPYEGVAEERSIFDLDLPDEEITKTLNERINNSRTFWNNPDGFNLRERRKRNLRFLVGDQWHNVPVLQYHVPYVQNEVWTAEHVTSALITGKLPELEVLAAQDTPESRALAQDVKAMIKHHSEEHDLQGKLANVVLSVLNNYIGYIELIWDENCGKNGDIKPKFLNADDVIIDKRARMGENPAFICITKQADSDKLISMFPKAKDKIKDKIQDKNEAIITYRKVLCTYYEDGKPYEGVVYYFEDVVLEKSKNPDWIYDEETEGAKNMLPYPYKMVIPFNFMNDGSYWIDRAGPIDQAIPLQLMVNRIGKQIQEGVAHASPVLVFNKRALSKPNADNVTGQPWEKILVDAEDVRNAYGVIQANQVPQFVVQEIERLKGLIHEVFGTPPQLRGQSEYRQTLGQDLMAREQAEGRQELLIRAIDRGLDMYYKCLLQMMKVYYTEDHYTAVLGEDGKYDFISINREKIEDGIKVIVKAGSTLPQNKARMQQVALELAKYNRISNLSLYEFLDIPNPGKHVERLVKETVDPVATVEDIRKENADKKAMQDFQSIAEGETPEVRDEIDIQYIQTMQQKMLTEEFINDFDDDQKMAFRDLVQASIDKMKLMNNISDEELYADGMAPPGMVSPEAGGMPGQQGQTGAAQPQGAAPPISQPSNTMV